MNKDIIRLTAKQILDLWHSQELVRIPDKHMKGVPLYVILTVYSYETLEFAGEYAIMNYSSYFKLENNSSRDVPDRKDQHSVSESLRMLEPLSIGELNSEVFRNHQTINATSWYAKSKVVIDFLKALQAEGINYIEDLHSISNDFIEKIRHIPDVNHELLVQSFKLIAGIDAFSGVEKVLCEYLNLAREDKNEIKVIVKSVIDYIGWKEEIYFTSEEIVLNVYRLRHCQNLSNYKLFKTRPNAWSLRGDRYFWPHLRSYFATFKQAQSIDEVEELFHSAWNKITQEERGVEQHIYIPEIEYGGMSGGYIDVNFWKTKGLEQLRNNFIE